MADTPKLTADDETPTISVTLSVAPENLSELLASVGKNVSAAISVRGDSAAIEDVLKASKAAAFSPISANIRVRGK